MGKNKTLNKYPNIYFSKRNKLNTINAYKIKYSKNKTMNNISGTNKQFVPSIKEWSNSIYTYKKEFTKLLPAFDKAIYNLLKSYLNFYNVNKNRDGRSARTRIRNRRYSFKRVIIGKPNFKHTSKNIIIFIYLYNRRAKYLSNLMYKANTIDSIPIKNYNTFIYNVKTKLLPLYNFRKVFVNKNFIDVEKNLIHIIKKYMSIEINSIILKQLDYVEKSKYNKYYLLPLINLIEAIYKKRIMFNFINVKYIYHSASILSDSIVNRLKKRKKKPADIVKKGLDMFNLPLLDKFVIFEEMYNKKIYIQNMKLKNLTHINKSLFYPTVYFNKDLIEQLIEGENIENHIDNINKIIKLLKYKFTTGVRIEIAGRLTKRNIADRSVYISKYKGNLKDSDSSFKGLSSTLLRGYAKSSVLYKQSKSKLHIGSFGVKSWVNTN